MLFTALLATILLEFLLYWAFTRKDLPPLILYSILINSFTLPPATWIYQNLVPDLLMVEVGVIVVETVLIGLLLQIPPGRAFLLSILANGTTAVFGLIFPFP
jgi:hypothetical protein